MPVLSISHVSCHFGGPLLLDDVSLDVEPGARIGVVGANGVGKSTLLKILGGTLDPTAGGVVRARGARVATTAQEPVYEPGTSVRAELRRVFRAEVERDGRLRGLEERLALPGTGEDDRRRLLAEYERLQHEHEAAGGYDVERRIEAVLSSLGLPPATWDQAVERFSGGERNVVGLAQACLAEPDVMLLDEPSNHLDMDGVDWFIEFVRSSDAAVVMVSHNRHLLDAVAETIWEVRGGKVTVWTGNYGDFQRQKAEALALQERQWKVQERLERRIRFQARRLLDMAKVYDAPGQAKRAKAMLARLERMPKVDRPDAGADRFRAEIAGGPRHGRIALTVKGFSFSYGDRPIFEDADLEIEYGERVCLVGPNGSGKTTLFREVLSKGSWDDPVLRLGKSVVAGEYRQLHDRLDPRATLLDWTCAETGLLVSEASSLLHRFLFTREDLARAVGTLSGGEKSRLQLARLVHAKVNFLLLDEPTNHLDVDACEQLEEMLEEWEGTLLVISHDRWFLDRLVSRVVEVKDRRLASFRGTFAEWLAARDGGRREGRRALTLHSQRAAGGDAASQAEGLRQERKAREREARRLRADLQALEAKIARLEERQADLTRRLEGAWGEGADLEAARRLTADVESVRAEIERLYAAWSSLAESLETGNGVQPAHGATESTETDS